MPTGSSGETDQAPRQDDGVDYLRGRAAHLENQARATAVVADAVELMRIARLFRDEASKIEAAG